VPKESLTGRQESVFPSASTVRGDLGERLLAQRFPGFADTEEVTGSNPVAPTIILAGHGVAGVEPVALATWLGRAGAARRPRRRARMRLPGPSTRPSGSAITTQRSRSSRSDGRPARCPAQPRANQPPARAQSPATGAPGGGLARLVGRVQPPAKAPPGPGPRRRSPPACTRPPHRRTEVSLSPPPS
jgi:hypothetical protein